MPSTERTRDGEDVIKEAFGASLYEQGRGFYVALELIAILWGTNEAGAGVLPTPSADPLRYRRRSHDFARRLLVNPEVLSAEERTCFQGTSERTVRAVLGGLAVPIPGRRRPPQDWIAVHLYPYVPELVHYDAVRRHGEPHIERYLYRGGGGLAHRILRTDPRSERLDATRRNLSDLFRGRDGALGRLMSALTAHDVDRPGPEAPFVDEPEQQARVDEKNPWTDLLRQGVHNIAARTQRSHAERVEGLMHWVPYCIARMQHAASIAILDLPFEHGVVPVDFGSRPGPLREASRQALDSARGAVGQALETTARRLQKTELLARRSQTWREASRSFMTGTLGAVGGLNSLLGRRHFCVRSDLLRAIVAARLSPGEETPLEQFMSEHLLNGLQIAVGPDAVDRCKAMQNLDVGELQRNADGLARALRDLGLLRAFSDQTRMVGAEVA